MNEETAAWATWILSQKGFLDWDCLSKGSREEARESLRQEILSGLKYGRASPEFQAIITLSLDRVDWEQVIDMLFAEKSKRLSRGEL